MSPGTRRDLLLATAVGLAVAAALVTMSEVFVTADWVRPTAASVGLSLLVAVAARAASLPAVAALAASLVGWVVVATALHLPAAPLVPGLDELRALRELGAAGLVAMRDEPAPTEPLPELVFLLSAGAWWVTFSAHELAVRLRRSGLALAPVAALWVVPLAMPQAVQPSHVLSVPFLVAAAFVLTIDADADLLGWARDRIAPRVTIAGATIATGAIALGLLAPWLLPGIDEPALLDVGTGRNPRGYQPLIDVGDRLNLPVERPVLRVRSDRRVYLRLAALDTYDDGTWRIGPPGEGSFTPERSALYSAVEPLPFETPIAESVGATVDVEVLDLENIYVPTPYQPVEVRGPGAAEMVWSTTGGFLATGELSDNELGGRLITGVVPGFEYEVEAAIPDPSIEALRSAEPDPGAARPWLQLPGDDRRWTPYADLAERVYEAAGATSTVDRVLALQRWFTTDGGFEYSLSDVDRLVGTSGLETFLFDTRVGYCEYFSTAMAVMLRASGIPARTAVGFLPGELVEEPGADDEDRRATFEVSTSDAHAWVEVLFPGQGWITFDPTPRADGTTLPPDESDLSPEVPLAERDEPADAATDAATTGPDVPDLPPDAATDPGVPLPGTTAGADDFGGGRRGLVRVVGLVLVVVVAVAALLSARSRRTTRSSGDEAAVTLAAQRRVLREGERLGTGRGPGETAPEVLHRWAGEGRVDPTSAATLAALAQRAAFAPPGAAVDGARATALADELVASLREAAPRRARALAPLRVPVDRGIDGARRLAAAARERVSG